MATPRGKLLDAHPGGVFHCFSRCVRRAFLCGYDAATNRSFEHRRAWIEARLALLGRSFAVSVHSYAIMHNHYHLVLQMQPEVAETWRDEEVAHRWLAVYPGRTRTPTASGAEVLTSDSKRIALLRARLANLSWFMRALNEFIARRANREDECTGHFWEGRFHAQALLQPTGVLGAMVYVDLNPIRAGIAESVIDSKFTSGRARLLAVRRAPAQSFQPLEPIAGVRAGCNIAMTLGEYLELLDWTCALARDGPTLHETRTPMFADVPSSVSQWRDYALQLRSRWWRAVGDRESLRRFAARLGQRWLKGCGCRRGTTPDRAVTAPSR